MVTVASTTAVTATFALQTVALSVGVLGSGTVTSSDGQVNCPAICSATYTIGASPAAPGTLAISEIHYNPAGSDDTDFVELVNRSTGRLSTRPRTGCSSRSISASS